MPAFMRGGPEGFISLRGRTVRARAKQLCHGRPCAIRPSGTPAAPLAPSPFSPAGLSWLSGFRERANINNEKEDIMNTSTGNTRNDPITRQDVYTRVTDQIVADLEHGVRPWIKPWSAEHAAGKITRPLRHNGTPYSGINILMLWSAAIAGGFAAPIWMTFKQALELNAHVRKGEKGSLVVYANSIMRKETDEATGEHTDREIHFMKGYTVFNVEQIEGLPDHYYAKPEPRYSPIQRINQAESFFGHLCADIRHGGTSAYYAQDPDYIRMPPFEAFESPESYYATLAHESTHWTKHPARLAREFGRKKWGDEGYAEEELVAELGAAFLCADLELSLAPREDHAAYIAHWLTILRNDKRAIFRAASYAQRAADFLHDLQPPA
jgi:antirestriction protein ArdC